MTSSGVPKPPKADVADFGFGTQIRKSPYFDATVRWGATGFSTYNHMYIPRDFGDPEQNFWNLVNEAIPATSLSSARSRSPGPMRPASPNC